MNRAIILVSLLVLFSGNSYSKEYRVSSPDGNVALTVSIDKDIKWSASAGSKEIINSQRTGMILYDGNVLGENEKIKNAKVRRIDEIIRPVIAVKRSEISDRYNSLLITFKAGFALQFRVYNDGFAYRFETFFDDDIIVKSEISELQFPSGSYAWYPLETGFMSHNERTYIYSSLDTVGEQHLASLPALFQTDGTNILITESDIDDYPGMWLLGGGSGKISGVWPEYPDSEKLSGDRDVFVTSTRDYIATTKGSRTFPWRVFVVAGDDIKLVESDLGYKLGLERTYPNALTREGVKGSENNKWSRDVNPDHDVTLPFTRMVAGPMDYTPGAMINMDSANFSPQFYRPESQGTRAHQVALYVIYESPLQMLADSPSYYMKEQETTDFIVNIPVVWDDIRGLGGKVGDYILLARRSGKDWFVGAITDWTGRELDLDLSFLPVGEYIMEIFQDGVNADRYAGDYKILKREVRAGDKMKIYLAPGGGYAARITPKLILLKNE